MTQVQTQDVTAKAITDALLVNGKVAQRQGGTTGDNDWTTSGTSNTDTSAKAILIQVGSNTTNAVSDTTITFPTAFTQKPLVFLSHLLINSDPLFFIVVSVSTTTCVIRCTNNADGRNAEPFFWMAVGQ